MAAIGPEVTNEKTRSPRTSFQAEQRTPELAPEAAPPPDSPGRPNHPQSNTPFSNPTANQTNYDFYADAPPPLNYRVWGVKGRARAIIIWGVLFFIEAGVLPLVLFYGIRWGTHLSLTTNLAIITSLIGTVSGLKMTQRTWYLWIGKGHEHRRPIGAGRWGVDCIHVLLGMAMFAFFTPLVIGSSLSPAVPEAVAMALPCVMITFGLPLLVTGLFTNKIRLPFRVSSLPPGQPLPPLVYMYVEDIVAVDGGGGHEFRQAWRTRYEESRIMRKIVRDMSVFWGLSGVVLGASFIAIDWTVDVDPGYGISYGLPWLWAAVSTAFTYFFVQRMLVREKENWVAPKVHKERILPIEEGKYDRPSLDQVRRRSTLVPRRPGPPHNLDAVNENRPLTESPTMHSAPALPEPARLPARDREPTVQIHERVQSV